MGGFEPPTSRTLSKCANRTALHLELAQRYANPQKERVIACISTMNSACSG